jgi:hypothetical protein
VPMTNIPPLQAGEAVIEGVFVGDDGAFYARILYRLDTAQEVVSAWLGARREIACAEGEVRAQKRGLPAVLGDCVKMAAGLGIGIIGSGTLVYRMFVETILFI